MEIQRSEKTFPKAGAVMGWSGRCSIALSAGIFVSSGARSHAAVIFFTDRNAFNQTQPVKNNYDLNASTIVKATELAGLTITQDYTLLGYTLDYTAANTGLPFGFQLNSLSGYQLHNRNNIPGVFGPQAMSSGDVQSSRGSDFDIKFGSGKSVLAFGFNDLDNEGGPDQLLLFDSNNNQIGSFAVPIVKDQFIGVVSDQALSRVFFDDGNTDYSVFNGFTFGYVPNIVRRPCAEYC